MDQAQTDEDREVLTQVSFTQDELKRFKLALAIGGFLLLAYMRRTNINSRQISQLMTHASETTKYLEGKEIADAMFAKNLLENLIEKKGV